MMAAATVWSGCYAVALTRSGTARLFWERPQWFGAWYWVNLAVAYGLVVAGSAALLRLVVVSEYRYTDQAALLAVGVVSPLLANGASVLGLVPLDLAGIDLTPYAFTVSGVAFGNALFRYRLFELLPATRRLGRQTALPGDVDMTDRQREALEAAYRAGYFEWPRESSADAPPALCCPATNATRG